MSENNRQGEDQEQYDGHLYDGIEELDNPVPLWLQAFFYSTVFFGIAYFAYYGIGPGESRMQWIDKQIAIQERIKLQEESKRKTFTSEELKELRGNPEVLATGKAVYNLRCASCHAIDGGGGIGPNLADDYWIHGNQLSQIAQVIQTGVLDKGMPAWGGILSDDEVASVTVYVNSFLGTKPANPKKPQGELMKEGS